MEQNQRTSKGSNEKIQALRENPLLCPFDGCEQVFNDETDLNCHCLWVHKKWRGYCTTNTTSKNNGIAETLLPIIDISINKHTTFLGKRVPTTPGHYQYRCKECDYPINIKKELCEECTVEIREYTFPGSDYIVAYEWLKEHGYYTTFLNAVKSQGLYNYSLEFRKEYEITESEIKLGLSEDQGRKARYWARNNFKDWKFEKELTFIVNEVMGSETDYWITDNNRFVILQRMLATQDNCKYYDAECGLCRITQSMDYFYNELPSEIETPNMSGVQPNSFLYALKASAFEVLKEKQNTKLRIHFGVKND